ncbi:MAG: hypothetical protein KDI44_16245 [Thiothrix sp.]|nr:hypothetical protein [Thiothrix sp.]HPQ94330.1 hypothetical protein [Thiolinea sp.]
MNPIFAMWSGPRNLSTAMMRAWENRPDSRVWDEPFYAAYLARTGLEHPMRKAIITHHEADPAQVIRACTTPYTGGVFYQKHMTHHLLPDYPLDWLAQLSHCFLLRDPHEVLLSYAQKREQVTLEDIGLPQQLRLYRWVKAHVDAEPLVVDAKDFLQQPEAWLRLMCQRLQIPFYPAMLNWPAGPRNSDGIWASHWYDSVWQSTGFGSWRERRGELDATTQAVYQQAEPLYRELRAVRTHLPPG